MSRYRETTVHGFDVIFGASGSWLPNDPRGSWSDFVGSWELWRFGPAAFPRRISCDARRHPLGVGGCRQHSIDWRGVSFGSPLCVAVK
ncbi:MAG: hypothetical protein FJ276_29660, partial [Planctomycetes bacterium]|nr:hypothetical protein [Planctomycetota bacterium]